MLGVSLGLVSVALMIEGGKFFLSSGVFEVGNVDRVFKSVSLVFVESRV